MKFHNWPFEKKGLKIYKLKIAHADAIVSLKKKLKVYFEHQEQKI